MSRSKSGKSPFQTESDDSEEIEILEIVGVDDATAVAGDMLDLDKPATVESDDAGQGDAARLVRLRADFENYKKRVDREREATQRQAGARLVKELLPVLDNFERAVAAKPSSAEESSFHDGFALIFRQLLEALRAEGLSAIDSLGQPFDPNLHEAVATDPGSELPHNTVVEEMQRGYMLHDRLLRPALVKVSMGTSGPERADDDGRS